ENPDLNSIGRYMQKNYPGMTMNPDTKKAIEGAMILSAVLGPALGKILAEAVEARFGMKIASEAGTSGISKGAAEAAETAPNRIYSSRELIRRGSDPGPMHNFPESINKD